MSTDYDSTPQLGTASPVEQSALQQHGLYDAAHEHDACGLGFVAQIKGIKSHSIVQQGLKILENLDHRGAVGADKLMGDGAGILIQIPDDFYRAEMAAQGVTLPPPGEYGVGMVFLPKEHASRLACVQELERAMQGRRPGAARLARRAGRPRHADVADGARQGAGDPPDLHRPRPRRDRARRAGAQALRHPQDGEQRDPGAEADAQPRVLRAQHELPHRHLQGPAAGRPGGPLLPGPGRPARRLGASRWCTSAFPPTPSPNGRWRTRTAWSRTTARSTPSRATSTGCARAKA